MNWLVVHVAGGQSFFSGLCLLIVAALLSATQKPGQRRPVLVIALVGVVAITVSSTAIPYWAYALLAVALIYWIVCRRDQQRQKRAAIGLAAACALCASIELPYHALPAVNAVETRDLAIIGDSVTAGGGVEEREVTWPDKFARDHQVRVEDFSHVGETAASALRRVRGRAIESPIMLVEIGGNDILGSTTARQFAVDLDALLAHLAAPERQVVMFELPLPPFYHEYGRIQREAARRHRVALIPKRVFLGLLAGNGSTFDSIHLSPAGHQQMADLVWELVGPAYPVNPQATTASQPP